MPIGSRLALLPDASAAACAPGSGQDRAVASDVTTEHVESAADHPQTGVTYGGTYAEARLTPLADLDRTSVGGLGLVWAHDLGLRGGHEATRSGPVPVGPERVGVGRLGVGTPLPSFRRLPVERDGGVQWRTTVGFTLLRVGF